jgi:glucose/arabinose dehydrogenase
MALRQNAQGHLAVQPILSGWTPYVIAAPPGDASRLMFGDATGVRAVDLATGAVGTFVSPPQIGEDGVLGIAFHPQFQAHPVAYVCYTAVVGPQVHWRLVQYRAMGNDPRAAELDPASARVVLEFVSGYHNGGWIGFGPDGFLYATTGDAGDYSSARTILNNLRGKVLRLDVDGPDNIPGNADDDDPATGRAYRIPPGNPFDGVTGDREIWAWGLRNPFKASFDRVRGDMFIADVGQRDREEINIVPVGHPGGIDFGWACWEGSIPYTEPPPECTSPGPQPFPPTVEYDHLGGMPPLNIIGSAVIGGHVYRGSAMGCVYGHYFFADIAAGVFSFRYRAGMVSDVTDRSAQFAANGTASVRPVYCLGEDAAGELYVGGPRGLFRITGVVCSCDRDYTRDGNYDQDDVAYLINILAGGANPNNMSPDFNRDGNADQDDAAALIDAIAGGGCP